jgi:anti-sigma B factor antagonist
MNSAAVHAPIGDLTIPSAQVQREVLLAALAEDGPELLLDLSQIESCDSAGVQLLVATQRSARAGGRELRIVGASTTVREALKTYALDRQLLGTAEGGTP